MSEQTEDKPKYESVEWAEFLQSKPPGTFYDVRNLITRPNQVSWHITTPRLQLYCAGESCDGLRFFDCLTEKFCPGIGTSEFFLDYRCSNCINITKHYALRAVIDSIAKPVIVKIGEFPPFGPQTPARVVSMMGPDKDIFLKGRRSETQGLGIGAFAYYRRVVENQKGRIINQIENVARRLGAKEDILRAFQKAASETQFSRAIDDIKESIPQSLLIRGHNPLTLLHTALSEGIHAQTDEECLEIASSIRVILTDLAERISAALRDDAELTNAVSRVLHRHTSAKADAEQDS
ncbi:MAG TPA: hypothetical protein VGD61_28010 [Pyrinomonadaceae bacterium]